jgi:mannosylglycerate hydrolase
VSAQAVPTLTCHVVTHVHWDREWYRPFESFRSRLVGLVESVCDQLDDGRMERFHLDGQTVTVADVIEVRPGLEARVADHVRAGRLTIGPWHVLADNQLVSAETLVRNLEHGTRWVRRLGGSTRVGYSPDAFGHPADLPRLLAGFGSGSAVVWRGAPAAARFRWRSPDGSEVLTVNQGYHEAQVLWRDRDPVAAAAALAPSVTGPDDPGADGATWAGGGAVAGAGEGWAEVALRRLAEFVDRERARTPDGPLLLLDGGDHLLPEDTVGRLALLGEAARERLGVDLVASDLDAFVAAVEQAGGPDALPVVEGELRHRGGWLTFLLAGTLSTRTWLKQANDAAQARLERFVEPLLARAVLEGTAGPTAIAQLDRAWELTLHNAPHDSVCGCSVDAVHRENRSRAERVEQVAADLVLRAQLADGLDTRLHGPPSTADVELLVRNPHARPHTGPVEVEVVLAPGHRPVALLDPDGAEQPVEVVAGPTAATGPLHFEADVDLLPDAHAVDRFTVAFVAREVPALGWSVHRLGVTAGAGDQGVGPVVEPDPVALVGVADGRRIAVADDGSVRVVLDRTDGGSGADRAGLLRLLDDGDRGDSYTHDPVPGAPVAARVLHRSATVSPVRTRVVADAVLDLPTRLTPDRAARSGDLVACPVRVEATAWAGLPGVHVRISVDNRAEDHRLRAVTPVPGARTWRGLSHWSVLEHPVGPEHGPLPQERGHEAECAVRPVHGLAVAGTGAGATAVLARGLPEVAGLADDPVTGTDPVLAVTLLRAVGWLSQPDLAVRTAAAGPMLATPDAQVPGPFEADVVVLVGDEVGAPGPGRTCPEDLDPDAALVLAAQAHRTPLVGQQLRPGVPAPARRGPATSQPSVRGALLSAFAPAPVRAAGTGTGDDPATARLRVWNPTGSTVRGRVDLPAGTTATLVRLDGEPEEPRRGLGVGGDEPGDGSAELVLGPWGVRTLELRSTR